MSNNKQTASIVFTDEGEQLSMRLEFDGNQPDPDKMEQWTRIQKHTADVFMQLKMVMQFDQLLADKNADSPAEDIKQETQSLINEIMAGPNAKPTIH